MPETLKVDRKIIDNKMPAGKPIRLIKLIKCGKSLLASIFMCLIAGACSFNSGRIFTGLDSLLTGEFHSDEPGGVVLIMKGDKTLFLKCYGLADLASEEKITANTLFNLGSVSKTFVSNAILILRERGLISLEDSLCKYFDDFRNHEVSEKVRINHMLSHTSGLPDNRNVAGNREFFLSAKDIVNFEPLKFADSLNFEPGTKFEYSNPAFNGLALIIEKVTGRPWQDFIRENIFIPSGMTGSRITDGPYPQKGVAHAYEFVNGKYNESDYGEFPTFAAAGNGGVWSSVSELALYEKSIKSHLFLNKELTEQSRSVFYPENWADTISPFIGYSWFIGKERFLDRQNDYSVDFVYHAGDQGGFRAFYISVPEKDVLYLGLFNRPPGDLNKIIKTGIDLLERNDWLE